MKVWYVVKTVAVGASFGVVGGVVADVCRLSELAATAVICGSAFLGSVIVDLVTERS